MGEQTAKAPGLNRAKTYQLVLFPLNNGATNVYYVLVLSYIATFGSKVLALSMIFASVMVTGMRLFDAITDPIIGALMDRTNGKFGKFRPFMVIGNLIMAASILVLYCLTPLIPASSMAPLEGLLQRDRRNREICYEHITADMKRLFLDVKVANKPLQKEEQHMFYYAVMQRVMSDSKLRQCGFRPKEGSYLTDEEQFAAAGRITAKQQAALTRAYLVDFFRSAAPEYRCTDETLLTGMMCRFADLNFAEQSKAVQQQYLETYEKRKARLQEQIDALHAKAEAEEMAVSMQEAPDFEPETMPDLLPDETPDAAPQPLIIPMDPDIEPDTRMPEEMKAAA